MKQFYLILTIIVCLNLFVKGQDNYDRIKLKDIEIFVYQSHNGIDTIPDWIKLIKKYRFQSIDTSIILLSDANSAIKFGRQILDSQYGKKMMDSEEPFKISLLENKFWLISGSLNCKDCLGGTAFIIISKYNREIIYMTHYK